MKTNACHAADLPMVALGDEFRVELHRRCPGHYREAPSMQVKDCDCSCHHTTVDQISTRAISPRRGETEEAPFPILLAETAQEAQPTYENGGKRLKRPNVGHKGGRCEHCGAVTAGGRFAPGHDAKLKSELAHHAVKGDDPGAWAEIILRGWEPLVKEKPAHHVIQAALDEIANEVPGHEYNLVHRRVERRLLKEQM